jgi:hypothetical protein
MSPRFSGENQRLLRGGRNHDEIAQFRDTRVRQEDRSIFARYTVARAFAQVVIVLWVFKSIGECAFLVFQVGIAMQSMDTSPVLVSGSGTA